MKIFTIATLMAVLLISATECQAQNVPESDYQAQVVSDQTTVMKAVVNEVTAQTTRQIPGTDTIADYQTIKITVLTGPEKGKEMTVNNDYLKLEAGDIFYLKHISNSLDGTDFYSVQDPYRLPALYSLIALFIICVVIFGGWPGVRGIASLVGSLVLILYALVPGILSGYSPILVSITVASIIIILGSYITHGFNKTTSSAVIGMIITVLITGALAYWSVHSANLSGYTSEEAVYLNFNTRGTIDFVGLLFGGIIIGLLGVLYDVAISQAIAVEELYRIGPHLPKKFIFSRAIRIGREHIGALVNTLAIAYVGASLPLLLLFHTSGSIGEPIINQEVFATEIVRTMIGSIGLILGVPVTTFLAVLMIMKRSKTAAAETIAAEKEAVAHAGHHH